MNAHLGVLQLHAFWWFTALFLHCKDFTYSFETQNLPSRQSSSLFPPVPPSRLLFRRDATSCLILVWCSGLLKHIILVYIGFSLNYEPSPNIYLSDACTIELRQSEQHLDFLFLLFGLSVQEHKRIGEAFALLCFQ